MRRLLPLLILPLFAVPLLAQDSDESPSFRAGGFGSIDATTSSSTHRSGFRSLELDLYSSGKFNSDWSALAEVVVQHLTGGQNRAQQQQDYIELDLERLYVQWKRTDALSVELGEIHTGIIHWNEREHRSRFLQTTIDVPFIARREKAAGAWPIHFVGLYASGRVPASRTFTYGLGFGTGRGTQRDDIQIVSDDDSSFATLATLGYAPERVPGLEFQGAVYVDHIPSPVRALRERDGTLSASYTHGGVEVQTEWSEMRHHPIGLDETFVTKGGYVVLSSRLHGELQALRPYLMGEKLEVDQREQYLRGIADQRAVAAGLRWDAARHVTVKGELRRRNLGTDTHDTIFRAQVAFSF